jgi:epoxyqueuosine reductase
VAICGEKIKAKAMEAGFDFCGIAKAEPLEDARTYYTEFIAQNKHGDLHYLETQLENRLNPQILFPGIKSVIALLLNYYPPRIIPEEDHFILSKYAYGKDYHLVMKEKMKVLTAFMKKEYHPVKTRSFVDSGPVLEKTWAQRCGAGWQGKNTLLVNRSAGSFFFIGIILTDLELDPDAPEQDRCGTCHKCQDACPTGALAIPYRLDISRCIVYHTIESTKEIPEEISGTFRDRIFGCDICQDVCPYNKSAVPHHEQDFIPAETLFKMRKKEWFGLTEDQFTRLFHGSSIIRTGYDKLMRTINEINGFHPE